MNGELPSTEEDNNGDAQLVIWGTDVIVSHCKKKFKKFIISFMQCYTDIDERCEGINTEEPFYLQKLREVFVYKFT